MVSFGLLTLMQSVVVGGRYLIQLEYMISSPLEEKWQEKESYRKKKTVIDFRDICLVIYHG